MKRAAISPNAVARKLNSNLGSENQGKVLGVDSTGAIVPVEMSSGAKLYIVSGTITNASGSYTTTINNEFITAEMKAVEMELGTPSIFGDKITVTCGAGFVTISCPSVSGTSTYKISLIKSIDDPTAVTSTEFDILSNRIGTLSNLHTTDKTTIVAAVNENTDAIGNMENMLTLPLPSSNVEIGKYNGNTMRVGCYQWIGTVPTTGSADVTLYFPVNGQYIIYMVVVCRISATDIFVGNTQGRVNGTKLTLYNAPTSSSATYQVYYWYYTT